jgi:hypothetical protein
MPHELEMSLEGGKDLMRTIPKKAMVNSKSALYPFLDTVFE